jgi:hypothetical protein
MYGKRHAVDLAVPGLAVEQCQAGQEGHAAAAGGQQLLAAFRRCGLADDPFAEHGDLVGADNQMSGVAGGQGAGFLFGQALDQFDGGLARRWLSSISGELQTNGRRRRASNSRR